MTVPEEGDISWAMMTCGNVTFMFQTFQSLGNDLPLISRQNGGSLLFYFKTSEIRKFFDQIKDNVKVAKGLEKTFYGATEFSIEDSNGYLLKMKSKTNIKLLLTDIEKANLRKHKIKITNLIDSQLMNWKYC